jgi:HEAT repeat protein
VMRNDEDASVRASAAQALGRMGKQAPLQPLLLALQDKAWPVREAAASALGESGQRVPVEPLLAVLRDPDASVRQAAQAILSSHTWPEVGTHRLALQSCETSR